MINRISLYIITRNKTTANFEILSTNADVLSPPTTDILPHLNIQDQCYSLFNKYITGSKNNFFTFLDIEVTDILTIVYFCFVPFGLKIEQAHFIPIKSNEINNKYIRQILNVV